VNDTSDPSGGVGFADVDGINSIDIGDSTDMLDTTDFADSSFRRRLAALRDVQIGLSGDYEPGDTNGMVLLKTQYDAGAVVYVHFLPTGAYAGGGYEYKMLVSDFSIAASVEDKITVSITLMLDDDGSGGGVQPLTT
jgi:hypothetical protein